MIEKIKLSEYVDEEEYNIRKIKCIANQLKIITKQISFLNISQNDFDIVMFNVKKCLQFWTGCTYVGERKSNQLIGVYQNFFNAYYGFLMKCKDSTYKNLRNMANEQLYKGILYRVLGHDSTQNDTDTKVNPEYNNIWVSWSKKELKGNHYFNSKLYGCKTYMTCNTEKSNNIYGIDLTCLNVSNSNEEEVVFPTIKETITNVEYVDNKHREDSGDE